MSPFFSIAIAIFSSLLALLMVGGYKLFVSLEQFFEAASPEEL